MSAVTSYRVRRELRDRVLEDEVSYELLRLIAAAPKLSQRDVARHLRISFGKANYCLQALVNEGWVAATNFKNSKNRVAHMYLLTPRGMREKAEVTARFLRQRVEEYEALRIEIARIRAEANRHVGRSLVAPSVRGVERRKGHRRVGIDGRILGAVRGAATYIAKGI